MQSLMAADQEVKVNGAYNVHTTPIQQFDITLTTGDIVLLISMVEDYIRLLEEKHGSDILFQTYYLPKYRKLSAKMQEAIEYDYEKAKKKCMKKNEKESDIGEDALVLAIKKAPKTEQQSPETEATEEESGSPKQTDESSDGSSL